MGYNNHFPKVSILTNNLSLIFLHVFASLLVGEYDVLFKQVSPLYKSIVPVRHKFPVFLSDLDTFLALLYSLFLFNSLNIVLHLKIVAVAFDHSKLIDLVIDIHHLAKIFNLPLPTQKIHGLL